MSGRLLWDEDAIGYSHGQCLACGARWTYVTDEDRKEIDAGHVCHDEVELASALAADVEGPPSALAASALAEALLAPGNEGIKVFAAHGGEPDEPSHWTVVWARGPQADRLRAWLKDEEVGSS